MNIQDIWQTNQTNCSYLIENKNYYTNTNDCDGTYQWIRILRICIICFSSSLLLINIILIIKWKQYVFNTIKLFLFVEIFYVISLLSVVPHNPNFNLGICQFIPKKGPINFVYFSKKEFYNCIIEENGQIQTAVQGFINLSSYALSYWFAVCITLYIKHVLQNTHKKFMLKQGLFICLVCLGIVLWFAVPFGLAFAENVTFSFGPTGYKFYSNSQMFFYGGIVNRSDDTVGYILVIGWMLFLPIIMFIYHIRLLVGNRRAIRELMQLEDLNPRQFFIIKSGKLSIYIFAVQIFNVTKLGFSFIASKIQQPKDSLYSSDTDSSDSTISVIFQWIVFVLNIIFDFMAVLLIFIYMKHYFRQGRNLQQRSQVMSSSLVSSFNAPAI